MSAGKRDADKVFAGSVPAIYDAHFVPLVFEPYALDIARRLAATQPERILEVAAGTGVVTRQLAAALPHASIVATDLNQAMLDQAAAVGTGRAVEWRAADAMNLPFEDNRFDAVVCQFGVMFFPDKQRAFAEARRVLRGGGVFLFNVWDRIEHNEFAETLTRSHAELYATDPPQFFARTPHGYYDRTIIARDLAAAGFTAAPVIEIVTARSRAASAEIAAVAMCQGTPLRHEIEARDPGGLDRATSWATAALARRFGAQAVEGRMQALVVTVTK